MRLTKISLKSRHGGHVSSVASWGQYAAAYKEAHRKACLSHSFVPKPTFPHEVKNESERFQNLKTKYKFEKNEQRNAAKMQHTTHMPISKEGVLKNDEYDPYAVIVLNQLWC